MDSRLERAYEDVSAAQRRLLDTIKKEFPIGARVRWETSRGKAIYEHLGEVLSYSYDTTVQVRNVETGKEYWLEASRLTRR